MYSESKSKITSSHLDNRQTTSKSIARYQQNQKFLEITSLMSTDSSQRILLGSWFSSRTETVQTISTSPTKKVI